MTNRSPISLIKEGRSMVRQQLIVCVEDEEEGREGIRSLLAALDFRVEVFASAEEFLASGFCEQAACLITDVKLRGMSGIELQHHLTRHGYRIPSLVITAWPDEYVRHEALGGGAVCFLRKPFKTEELVAGIRSALEISGSEVPASFPFASSQEPET